MSRRHADTLFPEGVEMKFRAVLYAAGVLGLSVAMADSLPSHKPGLWEITGGEARPGVQPSVQHVCLDAATEQLMYKVGAGASQKMWLV
jgi:hypothetical protein